MSELTPEVSKQAAEDHDDALTIAYMQGRSDGKIEGRKAGLEEAADIADKLIHVDCADQWSITRTGAFKSFSEAIRQRIKEIK